MRRSASRLVAVFCLGVAALWLSSEGAGAQPRKLAAPHMELEPEEHDFGSVAQDTELVYEFNVKNTGSEDLMIRRISTSCGCTAAVTSDRVVPPGGATLLRVTLQTRKRTGVLQKSISVASNDPRHVTTVRVKAFVEPPE